MICVFVHNRLVKYIRVLNLGQVNAIINNRPTDWPNPDECSTSVWKLVEEDGN